jgi:N-formylglutamate deformylase
MVEAVEVYRGNGPVILAMPHCGTWLPDEALKRLNETGRLLADTDWHIDLLYDGLLPEATIVRANFHRYLIDANRDPQGTSLYPGQNTTGLCPITDFDGEPIHKPGQEPDETEIAKRLMHYHAPYHAALASEIARTHERHGIAVVYDCHSIRSYAPFLFEGILADFNIGTNDSSSCAPEFEKVATEICNNAAGFTSVVNGRFKGGWTTRHYGRPHEGVYAIQMELAQSTYLETEKTPFVFSKRKAALLRPYLGKILENIAALAGTISGRSGT